MTPKEREYHRLYGRKYRATHPELKVVHNADMRTWRKSNNAKYNEYQRNYRKSHPEKIKEYGRKRNANLRFRVLSHYGMTCACCGESAIEFLCIDHMNGGGLKHTRQVGRGANFYQWLVRNNFPLGFQTLCCNCNMSKGHYGYCPHQRTRAGE